jgi:hypothetical protein
MASSVLVGWPSALTDLKPGTCVWMGGRSTVCNPGGIASREVNSKDRKMANPDGKHSVETLNLQRSLRNASLS